MVSIPVFNPVEWVSQIVVLIVVSFVVVLMVKYWDRVLVAITGDDRIHATSLDCIWWTFFRCFGTCNGDWTRILTRWPCCPRGFRGTNLVRQVGQWIGITTYTVELKNIVVGDLPWEHRGDFYLCVETQQNPPMVTSLAEEKLPKVVHFPEVITLRLRWSPLEEQVRISVKELNFFGSTKLCETHISAMRLLDWASEPNREKRFMMKPSDTSFEAETPPWLHVELSHGDDQRELDKFHGHPNTVRTATQDGHYKDFDIKEFKRDYTLLDNTGHAIQEPLEDDLQGIERRAWCVQQAHHSLTVWSCVAVGAYVCFRVYVGSCYQRFGFVAMAYLNKHTFPISTAALKGVADKCEADMKGAGFDPGLPCKPSYEQVMDMCLTREQGGHFPADQPRVRAFAGILADYGVDFGIPCSSDMCVINKQLERYDHCTVWFVIAALVVPCLVRIIGNAWVRSVKHSIQRKRAEQTRIFHDSIAADSGATATARSLATALTLA